MTANLLQWEPMTWQADAQIEEMLALHLSQYAIDTRVAPASTSDKVATPSVSVHVVEWSPYMEDFSGAVEGIARVTIRSNASTAKDALLQKSRQLHAQLKGQVIGALIAVNEAGQNVLHELVNTMPGNALMIHARLSRVANGVDDEHRHFVTEIDMRCMWTPRNTTGA